MSESSQVTRRGFLGRSLAAAGAASSMAAAGGGKAQGGQAVKTGTGPQPHPSGMPYGAIGKLKMGRLLMGGNLIAGCMHARDLQYVTRLFKAYNTEERILATLKLAEENGINTVLESGAELVAKYNKRYGGHMQIIPSVHPRLGQPEREIKDEVRRKADAGAAALYVWGAAGDRLVRAGDVDRIARTVQYIKAEGLPAGVGGHSLKVPMACEKHQVPCDFYVKTLHRDDYPSATPKRLRKDFIWFDGGEGWYDNMWCIDPEETIQFMKSVEKPWIAFKVLAAGAIHPRRGFAYAFDNGADFIGVGMFDFQVVEDCELAKRIIKRAENRQRPWRA